MGASACVAFAERAVGRSACARGGSGGGSGDRGAPIGPAGPAAHRAGLLSVLGLHAATVGAVEVASRGDTGRSGLALPAHRCMILGGR